MGMEPNNRAALKSLTGYRSLRWGKNVELIVTDQRSYRSEEPLDRDEAQAFVSADFPELIARRGDGDSRCGAQLQRWQRANEHSLR